MQTFLPYQDYDQSAACLDRLRLGKQRVEVLQMLEALNGKPSRWSNHPCTKLWYMYLESLVEYGVSICNEWIRRGYKDTCRSKIISHSWGMEPIKPHWLTEEFCSVHRSCLLYKDFDFYSQFNWSESPAVPDENGSLPYLWKFV